MIIYENHNNKRKEILEAICIENKKKKQASIK